MARNYANKFILAAVVVANLGTTVPIPTNEAQVRPLADLEPDQQREVWLLGGARFKLSPVQQKEAISMVKVGGKTQVEVAELFNVDRSTISRLVSERRVLERKA